MEDYFDTPEVKTPEDYLFIYEEPDNGWWYKIDTVDRLIDYHLKTAGRFGDAVDDIWHNLDGYKKTDYNYRVFTHPLAYPIVMYAEKHEISVYQAALQFRINIAMAQLKAIQSNGYIVVNQVGGYHSGPVEYKDWMRRKGYVWPTFKESDILIRQFPGGTHYYVRIGDMNLHNDDGSERFFSESDARLAAMRYVETGGANRGVDKDFISGLFSKLEEGTQGEGV